MKEFIYCAGQSTPTHALPLQIDEDPNGRWLALQTLLETSQVRVYLASADEVHQQEFPAAPKFEIAASAHVRERLSRHLSVESRANTASVLVAGGYAETLVTDVALAALDRIRFDRTHIVDSIDRVNPVYAL